MKITSAILAKIFLLIFFAGILIYTSILYVPAVSHLASEPDRFRDLILSYGKTGILVFIGFQILQVVIAAIPGEAIQVAGGYIYGAWLGTLYSLIGIIAGSTMVFLFARVLGFPILKSIIPSSKIERFSFFINTPKAEIITFILLLIPGFPKDILSYLAGVTPIKQVNFIIISAAARFPGIVISSFLGASIVHREFGKIIIVAIISVLFSLLGLYYRNKIISRFKD